MGYGLRAEEMSTGLLHDNRELLEHVIGEEEIQYFVGLLEKRRDPKMLQYLAALCSTTDRALSHNQELLTSIVFSKSLTALINTEVWRMGLDSSPLGVCVRFAVAARVNPA